MISNAFQHPCEPGLGIDIVHFSGLNEGAGDSGSLAATNGAREETIFSTRGDGTDRSLTDIVVELQTSVAEISTRFRHRLQGVADRLGQFGLAREPGQLGL